MLPVCFAAFGSADACLESQVSLLDGPDNTEVLFAEQHQEPSFAFDSIRLRLCNRSTGVIRYIVERCRRAIFSEFVSSAPFSSASTQSNFVS